MAESNGDEHKDIIEFNYWQGVVADIDASNDDLSEINKRMSDLMDVIVMALPAIILKEQTEAIDLVNSIIESLQNIQDPLIEIIQRSGRTMELISGRVKMLRRELGLDE